MTLRCPTCRRQASHDVTTCVRCGTELAVLFALERRYQCSVAAGQEALQASEAADAQRHFSVAREIHADATAPRIGLALAALLQGDYATALHHHRALPPAP